MWRLFILQRSDHMRFEMEPMSLAVTNETYDIIDRWFGRDVSGKLLYDYDEIMQHGSDELKDVVRIVTGGSPPAIYKEETA